MANRSGQPSSSNSATVAKESAMRDALSKVIEAEDSTEHLFTCMRCMERFDSTDENKCPLVFVPCGHIFCKMCVSERRVKMTAQGQPEKVRNSCLEDGCSSQQETECCTSLDLLVELSGKFEFKQQALQRLKVLFSTSVNDASPEHFRQESKHVQELLASTQ